ncbi:MAG: MFS transporter [Desulfotomaculales bacterium]
MHKRTIAAPEKANEVRNKNRYKRYVFFAVASLALFMSSASGTIVATALPAIERSLRANLVWTGWIITAYQLMTLTMMPLVGRISDEWGRKRVYMGSIFIFTFGSLVCALAPNISWLIAARFFQALGGGGFMPSAMGIVGDHFGKDRARAIGMFTSIFPLGGIVGPALGGWFWISPAGRLSS